MRWLLLLLAFAVLVVAVLIFMVVQSTPTGIEQSESSLTFEVERTTELGQSETPIKPKKNARHLALEDVGTDSDIKPKNSSTDPSEEPTLKFGVEFEKKWAQDRSRLGNEQHQEMERLWREAKAHRGAQESIEKLEKILSEYPHTNRAGCAALELGHQYRQSPKLDRSARMEKAARYWHMAEEQYRDSLCEYNAPAAGLSKLALATWVYQTSDPQRARLLLLELIEKHQGETNHLGQPLSEVAQKLLQRLK